MKKVLFALLMVLVVACFSGCTTLGKAKRNLVDEFNSFTELSIYRESDNLSITKRKDENFIRYKNDFEEGILTEEKLLIYFIYKSKQ